MSGNRSKVHPRHGSYEIHRALAITQKSAWFMMHRLRVAMQAGDWHNGKVKPQADIQILEFKELGE